MSSPPAEKEDSTETTAMKENAPGSQKEDEEEDYVSEKSMSSSSDMEENTPDIQKEDQEVENTTINSPTQVSSSENTPTAVMEEKEPDMQKQEVEKGNVTEESTLDSPTSKKDDQEEDASSEGITANSPSIEKQQGEEIDVQKEDQGKPHKEMKSSSSSSSEESLEVDREKKDKKGESAEPESKKKVVKKNLEEILAEEGAELIFDGTDGHEGEEDNNPSDADPEAGYAVALSNFVKETSVVVVSVVLRRFGKSEEPDKTNNSNTNSKDIEDSLKELVQPIAMKGRIILYTRLECHDCKEARLFLKKRRLRYVEINIDVYPSRKIELKKIAGSCSVPKVFFNEVLIGGLSELNELDESGKLDEKIQSLVNEGPSSAAPLSPLSGEDDVSTSGCIDELAIIAQKMKESIVIRDRFSKMRRFTNSFVGSEAVDFLSQDQSLEREEAIEFGRKLARKLFFQHVLEENVFEDGNHLYRFLDHDPVVSQCQNMSRGIIEVKPKPIIDISSRLRFLSSAILEAYVSEDGKHVDYRSIHGSEEFARYLRIVEELQRVVFKDISREEKLTFFIHLYNMMAIHAILVWGPPDGALERRKMQGDFKYVIGGCTYSLSDILNGILRSNQRPPYTLVKPFGSKDKRLKTILPYPEPLIHFALVLGNRSGPALRCYSPGNIDKELTDAARDFLRSGGLILDLNAKVASVSKILNWYAGDFGKNEAEALKHASNYLEATECQTFLELLADTQLKVVYQPYDWGLNY